MSYPTKVWDFNLEIFMYDAQYSNHLKVTYLGNYLEMTKEDMDNIMLRKKPSSGKHLF